MDVTLLTGQTVNLEHYGGSFVWWWSFAGFIIGMIWMVYWTVPKRTVTRLAVTTQIPVNDDAPDIGLITPRDHMWMDLLAGATIAMLVVGWIYMAVKFPVRLPQQTVRFAPEVIDSTTHSAQVMKADSTYDDRTDTLLINLDGKKQRDHPVEPASSTSWRWPRSSTATRTNRRRPGRRTTSGACRSSPTFRSSPEQTAKVQLKISSPLFDEERLIPLHDPQERIAGLLRFTDAQGHEDLVTLKTDLVPTEFRPQYLP